MPYPAPVPCLFPYCLRKQMHRTLSDVLSAHRTHGHSHVSYSHLDEIVDICASHDGLLKVLLLPGLHFLQFFHSFRFPAPCTAFLSSTMRHVLQQPHCVFCSAMCSAFQLRNVQCFSAAQCAVLFNCTFPTCCLGIYYRTLWLSIAIRLFHYTHSRSLAITFFDIPVGNFDFPYCAHRSHFQKAALQGAR